MENLCNAADEKIELSTYNMGEQQDVLLPSAYVFQNFSLRFLPFWGSCFIILDDRQLSVRLPRPGEKFSEYLENIRLFATTYNSLPRASNGTEASLIKPEVPEHRWQTESYVPLPKLPKREQLVIRFQNEMK